MGQGTAWPGHRRIGAGISAKMWCQARQTRGGGRGGELSPGQLREGAPAFEQ